MTHKNLDIHYSRAYLSAWADRVTMTPSTTPGLSQPGGGVSGLGLRYRGAGVVHF